MQEEANRGLFPEPVAADADAAVEAEQLHRKVLEEEARKAPRPAPLPSAPAPEAAAARALLGLAHRRRERCGAVFTRYLWVRVKPVFLIEQERLLPEISPILLAPDATRGMRSELAAR
jgi:hypothetical protein